LPSQIPKGTVLFRPGDPCRGFVVVREGTIRVTLGAANGREVVLYRVAPGDVCLQTFSCLVEGRDYSAEGVAETTLLADVLSVEEFRQRLARDEAFRESVFAAVARRFADFQDLVENVALTGLPRRLARVLLRLADDGSRVDATHEQLAREAASGRAAVSRQLGILADDGVVSLQRGGVIILDPRRLEWLARNSD
jgi:CRP/FNR family transcriptional regulator